MGTLLNGKGSQAAIAGIAVWLSACGAGASPSQATHSAAEHSDGAHTESAAPMLAATFEETGPFADPPAGSIEITMTIVSEEAFVPEEATAKAGTVTFFLRSDPGNTHNFLLGTAVDQPPLAKSPVMGSSETGILTIEDLAPGTYTYWCTVPDRLGTPHWQDGMVGTLTVTP